MVARLAAGLIATGVGAGEHVGIVMANFPEFVALKFAIARAGAVAVRSTSCCERASWPTCCASRDVACS